MNDKREQLWIDTLSGMQNRAAQLHSDDDADKRNRNWYARKIYGEQYEQLRRRFQKLKMQDLSTGGSDI